MNASLPQADEEVPVDAVIFATDARRQVVPLNHFAEMG
jgi:hypothetical protein